MSIRLQSYKHGKHGKTSMGRVQSQISYLEAVDHNRSRIAKSDLKDGLLVFLPPFLVPIVQIEHRFHADQTHLANSGMVLAKLQ